MAWLALLMAVLLSAATVEAGEGKITVSSTEVKGKRAVLSIHHDKVAATDQVHVFVDGTFVKAVGGRSKVEVDLEPGTHGIELRDATREFKLRNACVRLKAVVSAQEGGGSITEEGCTP